MDLRASIQAQERIGPYLKYTEALQTSELQAAMQLPFHVYLKQEYLQPTNSFKIRGAFNALLSLTEEEKKLGVIFRSAGNFAQAAAYAGKLLKIPVTAVMPENVSTVKLEGTKNYGACTILAGTTHLEAEAKVQKLATETGSIILSPYNHEDVISGAGTIALELLEQIIDLDTVLIPVGGGGLIAGIATVIKSINPLIRIIGVEPELANDLQNSLRINIRTSSDTTIKALTSADGLRAQMVGDIPWQYIQKFVDEVVTVSEEEIFNAIKLYKRILDTYIEPSAAVSIAALTKLTHQLKKTACIITGSNIDEILKRQL